MRRYGLRDDQFSRIENFLPGRPGSVGRDSQLGMPKLLLPSIQVNICAGQMPTAEGNGIHYLKIPLDAV